MGGGRKHKYGRKFFFFCGTPYVLPGYHHNDLPVWGTWCCSWRGDAGLQRDNPGPGRMQSTVRSPLRREMTTGCSPPKGQAPETSYQRNRKDIYIYDVARNPGTKKRGRKNGVPVERNPLHRFYLSVYGDDHTVLSSEGATI